MKRSIPHHDSRCSSCLVFVAVAVTALCVVTRSDAFPDGVPLNSCVDNMAYAIPPYAHLTKPSVFTVTTGYTSGNGNFQYSFSDTAWQAGVPFTLMINQTVPTASKSSIRGFFYQAFDSNRNRVGSWTFSPVLYNNATPLGRTIDCPNGQAVSHTIALGNGNTALRPKTLNLTVLINTPGVGTITIEGITLTDRVVYFQNSNLPPIPERVVAGVPATFVEPTAPPASLGYTMAEVAKHNTSVTGCSTTCPVTSCWIVLFGNVFNATDWAHYHASDASGGPIPCGTDSTLAYMNVSTHRPERIGLYDYYLGPLIGYVATANETINTPTTAPQVGTVLSVASVAQHNTTSSCWVIINQGVYDITAFIPIHQGGSLITIACGTNATALYALTPLHQVGLLPYRTKYLGALNAVITAAPTTGPPTTSPPTAAGGTTANPSSLLTLANVALHRTTKSCWTVISGNVYDLTDFIYNHPGGTVISQSCGIDSTVLYQTSSSFHIPANLPTETKLLGPLYVAQASTSPADANATTAAPVVTTTAPPPGSTINLSMVLTQNTSASCWIIISGLVFDGTLFAPTHPGGYQTFLTRCGLDATDIYLAQTQHVPIIELLAQPPLKFLGMLNDDTNGDLGGAPTTAAPSSSGTFLTSDWFSQNPVIATIIFVVIGVAVAAAAVWLAVTIIQYLRFNDRTNTAYSGYSSRVNFTRL